MLRAYHRAWANESLLCETEIVYYSEVDYRTPSYKRKGMQPLFIDSHIFFFKIYMCSYFRQNTRSLGIIFVLKATS